MKRLGLLPKLLFAIAVGILLGSIGPEWFIVNLPYTKTSLCYWCREVFFFPGYSIGVLFLLPAARHKMKRKMGGEQQ
ncbi:MAG: hypothetical protein JG781_1099 [Peptococcaceae bacterium]|jgi:hypothetical protein|nr:hypothetical protein [Peptococcaceae bacterium]